MFIDMHKFIIVLGNAMYNGVAPDALLAFTDIENTATGDLSIESAEQMFTPSKGAGARVHSNSWGSDYAAYYSSSDMDTYLYNNMVQIIRTNQYILLLKIIYFST